MTILNSQELNIMQHRYGWPTHMIKLNVHGCTNETSSDVVCMVFLIRSVAYHLTNR
jgi:hypothetical protein